MAEDICDDIQACVDAMCQALQECKSGEISSEEMWNEIETACQELSQLAAGDPDDDTDDEDAEDGEDDELDFDDGEDDEDEDFDDESESH